MKESKLFNWFSKQINSNSWHKVSDSIIYDIYNTIFFKEPLWIDYYNEHYCIIGFSEDKYDYYWICINNKTKELKFVTYLYKLKPNNIVTKQFNYDECKNIKEFVIQYFKEHKNENLIYLNDYINNYNYV